MKTLAFNFSTPGSRGSFEMPKNNLIFKSELQALVQKVGERLRFFSGEWLLDTEAGIPWLQQILTRPVKDSLVINLINDNLLEEKEITGINVVGYSLNRKNRKFNYRFKIASVFGDSDIDFNGAL